MATRVAEASRETPRETSAEKPGRRIPGEAGVWVFILGDMTMFAFLFGVYMYYQQDAPAAFKASQSALNSDLGAVNTLVLLMSSICVVGAVGALRRGAHRSAQRLLGAAFACGTVFALIKAFEYGDKLGDGLKPATDDFYMLYYVLTGLHLFHLVLGMTLLAYMWTLLRRPRLTAAQSTYFEGGACYWHMVDLLWLLLFPLLYLVH